MAGHPCTAMNAQTYTAFDWTNDISHSWETSYADLNWPQLISLRKFTWLLVRMSQYMIGTFSWNYEYEINYPSTYEVSNHIFLARIMFYHSNLIFWSVAGKSNVQIAQNSISYSLLIFKVTIIFELLFDHTQFTLTLLLTSVLPNTSHCHQQFYAYWDDHSHLLMFHSLSKLTECRNIDVSCFFFYLLLSLGNCRQKRLGSADW